MTIAELAEAAVHAYRTLSKYQTDMPPWEDLPEAFRKSWLKTAAVVARRMTA